MINSKTNSQIKNIIQLNTKTKIRRKEGLFVCEGIKMFREIPPNLMNKVYISEELMNNKGISNEIQKYSYEVVENKLFNEISDTKTPQGILSLVKIPCYNINEILTKKKPLLLFLEDIQDPGNLGTIIRTSEGAGVDGIIMSKGCVDITNPKVIRSTMGSIFRIPFVFVDNSKELVPLLREKKIKTFGTSLRGKKYYHECDYKEGTCFFIGNEGKGLKDETVSLTDEPIKIPMHGRVESLNAAMATGIVIYQAMLQRL